MKGILLLLTLLTCSYSATGQKIVEVRTATLVGGGYSLEGDVYLELFDDNSLSLRFDSNYQTQSNVFDVHVFLTNDNDYTSPIDTSGMLLIENIGTIRGTDYSSGAMTFDLPSEVSINEYDHIVFVCIRFGYLHWGSGVFGETTVSTIEDDFDGKLLVYPNPTHGNVSVDLGATYQSGNIFVTDVNGRVVDVQLFDREQVVNLSFDEPVGTYFIKVNSGDKEALIKLIKR